MEDGWLRDAHGHALFLRGINVHEAAKYHPDHIIPLTDEEIALLVDGGFNMVRLLTHWEAIEPSDGGFDDAYLGRYANEVTRLTAAGLYVVIDMHQDLWGPPFGNGAPGWACPDEIKEGYQPDSPWWTNYFSDQVSGCFDRFWEDPGLQDRFAAAWARVAAAVCDNRRVIGFDLLNEPWPASRLGEEDFDREILYRFYRRVAARIERACPGRVMFLEPSRAYDFGLVTPFELEPGDRTRVALAPHHYPPAVHEPGPGYDGDATALEEGFLALYRGYLDAGVPLWVGEYGGITSNPGFEAYLQDLHAIFYRHGVGSALWAYSLGDEGFSYLDTQGRPKEVFAPALSLPTPTLLPGTPQSMTPDFVRSCLRISLRCVEGRALSWIGPAAEPCSFDAEPAGVLSGGEEQPPYCLATCLRDGEVDVTLALSP